MSQSVHIHTWEPLSFFFHCIISSTAGAICLSSVLIMRSPTVVVMAGRSCSFTFACPKCHCSSGFGAPQWFKVAYDFALWCRACCTWPDSLGEFVAVRDTLYFVRVFTLLLSIQSPFQRASINSSPNRFKMRHNEGSKNHLTSVSRAVLKHELIDWTVITGALWNQPLSPVHLSGVAARGQWSPTAECLASDTDVKHMFPPAAQQK